MQLSFLTSSFITSRAAQPSSSASRVVPPTSLASRSSSRVVLYVWSSFAYPPELLCPRHKHPGWHPEPLRPSALPTGRPPDLLCPSVLHPGHPPDLLRPSDQPPGCPPVVSYSALVQPLGRLPFFSSQATWHLPAHLPTCTSFSHQSLTSYTGRDPLIPYQIIVAVILLFFSAFELLFSVSCFLDLYHICTC